MKHMTAPVWLGAILQQRGPTSWVPQWAKALLRLGLTGASFITSWTPLPPLHGCGGQRRRGTLAGRRACNSHHDQHIHEQRLRLSHSRTSQTGAHSGNGTFVGCCLLFPVSLHLFSLSLCLHIFMLHRSLQGFPLSPPSSPLLSSFPLLLLPPAGCFLPESPVLLQVSSCSRQLWPPLLTWRFSSGSLPLKASTDSCGCKRRMERIAAAAAGVWETLITDWHTTFTAILKCLNICGNIERP